MKEKLIRFMYGRYGNDKFNRFLMTAAMIAFFFSFLGGRFFYVIALLLLLYCYYRMFSKQTAKRSEENRWYLEKEGKAKVFLQQKKKEWLMRKTHHIYKCPNCKQKLRIPKGYGEVEICCRKCGTKFRKKS